MICRSSLWPSGHWANFRNCEYTHAQTYTKTHLPDMTIVVALSQVIPLSDFNVALGYDLSRPKQVLATHPRTRSPARTHTETYTHIHTKPCFPSAFSRCSTACICVTDTAYVCVFTSHVSKNVFQLCNGRCNMRTYDLPLTHKHTLSLHQIHTHLHTKSETYW